MAIGESLRDNLPEENEAKKKDIDYYVRRLQQLESELGMITCTHQQHVLCAYPRA